MLHTSTFIEEPRPAHSLDEARLAAFLARLPQLTSTTSPCLAISQFTHGQSNPTYLLKLGEGASAKRFVLRKKPPGQLLASAHAVDREHRVLSALAPTPVPVPRPLVLCNDEGVLGTQFYIMEFVGARGLWADTACTPNMQALQICSRGRRCHSRTGRARWGPECAALPV